MPAACYPSSLHRRWLLISSCLLLCCASVVAAKSSLPIQSQAQYDAEFAAVKTLKGADRVERLMQLIIAAKRFAPGQQQELLQQAVTTADSITTEPDHTVAQVDLALTHMRLKQSEKGDSYAEKAMAKLATADVILPTKAYLKLASYYTSRGQYERAEKLGLRCLEEAKYDTSPEFRGRCYNQLATISLILKRPEAALPHLDKAHSIFLSMDGDDSDIHYARVLMNYAVTYNMMEQYETSLTYNMRALDISEKLVDHLSSVKTLNNIAATFYYLEQFEKAEIYFERVVNLASQLEAFDTLTLSTTYMNLGEIRQLNKKFDEAEEALRLSVTYAETGGNAFLTARALAHLGAVQLEQGKLDQARPTLEKAHQLALQVNQPALLLRTHLNLGKLLDAFGDFETAESHLNQALNITQDNDLREERYEVIYELAFHYKAAKNFELAFDLLNDYVEARTKQYQENMKSKVAEFQSQFDIHEKEKEITSLRNQQALQTLTTRKNAEVRAWLTAFLGLLLVSILVILNRYRLSIKSKRIIEAKNEALESARAQLEKQARTDPLTKTKNRRAILEVLQGLIRDSKTDQREFCAVLMDIDFFKQFNDTHGHDCGDFVLVEIAQLLGRECRTKDDLARWGGEEFLLLLPDLSIEEAKLNADRLREIIARTPFTFSTGGQADIDLTVTMTMGVAEFDGNADVDSLIKRADERLYAGKSAGRNCVIAQ